MRKIISGVLALTLCVGILCACDEVESSSVQEPMSTTTSSVSDETGTEQLGEAAPTDISQASQSEISSSEVAEEASYLKITMKDWDQMNTDSKYVNMESILKYIADSGITTTLDVVDLVSALDKSGNSSKKITAYEFALKEINKNKKQ